MKFSLLPPAQSNAACSRNFPACLHSACAEAFRQGCRGFCLPLSFSFLPPSKVISLRHLLGNAALAKRATCNRGEPNKRAARSCRTNTAHWLLEMFSLRQGGSFLSCVINHRLCIGIKSISSSLFQSLINYNYKRINSIKTHFIYLQLTDPIDPCPALFMANLAYITQKQKLTILFKIQLINIVHAIDELGHTILHV